MQLLNKSAIILADSSSNKFNCDKGIVELEGKSLISRAVDTVKGLVDEIIVVTTSQESADKYSKLLAPTVRFVVEDRESKWPLVGALTGFEAASGEYSALLPFDSPFVSQEVLSLLFDCGLGKAATVPRYTNQDIEPIHAVYNTKQALKAAKETLEENQLDMQTMVEKMRGVRYMSMLVIEQLDPDLKSFFRVITPLDLKKAAVMFKPRKTSKEKQKPSKKR